MAIERREVDLIIKAISEGFDGASAGMDSLADSEKKVGEEAEKATNPMTELKSTIDLVVGAARVAGRAIKAAFDFAREGAAIRQTRSSFIGLLDSLDVAPDLLGKITDGFGDTVTEMEAMNSTSLLLAGTTGEFGRALAEATPQLADIAKAAQKLNPSLGTTTFLYDSLARGIKRSSPLILDNLGLIIKIGRANEVLAEQLGKSVSELTAEEEKMALLNETMRAGQILIDQVGGSTESATDAFDQFTTTIENLIDVLKEQATRDDGVIDGLNEVATATSNATQLYLLLKEALEENNITQEEYSQLLIEGASATDGLTFVTEALEQIMLERQTTQADLTQILINANVAERESAVATEATTEATEEVIEKERERLDVLKILADVQKEFEISVKERNETTRDGIEATQEATTAFFGLAQSLMDVGAAEFAATTLKGLTTAFEEGKIGQEDYEAGTRDVLLAFGLATEESLALATATGLVTKAVIDGKVAADDWSEAIDIAKEVSKDGAVDADELGEAFEEAGILIKTAADEKIDPATKRITEFDEALLAAGVQATTAATVIPIQFDIIGTRSEAMIPALDTVLAFGQAWGDLVNAPKSLSFSISANVGLGDQGDQGDQLTSTFFEDEVTLEE